MTAGTLAVACMLDALVGDPRWLPHPVRGIGAVISALDRWARPRLSGVTAAGAAGAVVAVGLPATVYAAAAAVLAFAADASALLGHLVEAVMAYTALAARDLFDHAMRVVRPLEGGAIDQARAALGHIVGRDTDALSETEIARAACETIAESTCDGIVAPLCYLVVGGAPLALAYKAVNTLDSMIGHVEPPYRDVGWASARLDDALNWAPARLSAWLIVLMAGVRWGRHATRRASQIYRRDRRRHASPNSGHPEAAMAGALRVQLGGPSRYDGVLTARPTLGDPGAPLNATRIREALALMWLVTAAAALTGTLILWRL